MKKYISKILATVMIISSLCVPAYASVGGGSQPGQGGVAQPSQPDPVELPTATVTELNVAELPTALTYALNFLADESTQEQLEAYGDWYADFVFTINKNATLNSNGTADGYLAGQYDGWDANWVKVPFENLAITANEPVKIMETILSLPLTYSEVCTNVRDFDCGVFFADEYLLANPSLNVKLELRIYNPENLEESYAIGDVYEFGVELPTTKVTELDVVDIDNIDLTYALNFLAAEATQKQLEVYGNWYADFVFTINKNATLNSNGTADGYLAGQYDGWDANWVKVPFENLAITANEPVRIMEDTLSMSLTYNEVYNNVEDFDCGVFFTDEYLAANSDLEVTLKLLIINPLDANETYVIGDEYTFAVKSVANNTIQGTATGNAVIIQDVDVTTAAQGGESITIDTNEFEEQSNTETVVNVVSLPATVIDEVANLGENASLDIVLANGESDATITMNKAALDAIAAEVANDSAQKIIINFEEAEALTSEQSTATANLINKAVYTLSITTENGTDLFTDASANNGGTIVVSVNYVPATSGDIVVQYLKADGTFVNVPFTFANNVITMYLTHFSEYVIYQNYVAQGTSSGSGISTAITIKFNSNGGSSIGTKKLTKGDYLQKPEDPTKDGFVFGGWYTDKELKTEFNFDNKVTKSFTLYAKWIEENAAQTPEDENNPADDNTADTEASVFTDVKEDAWYFENVKFANENNLMKGITETTFGPNDKLTRAMFVAILYRAEGEPAVNKSIPFGDVEAGSYYENAVIWAQQNEIVSGVTENEFAPDAFITREQMVTIMFRYAKLKGYDVAVGEDTNILSYDDADEISEYAIPAIQYACGSGLIKGKTETTVNPKDNTTRAEFAAVLQRFIEANKAE